MSQTIHITFRGEKDVLIGYEDHGYEPDTNAHDIDWWFEDERFKGDPNVTDEEEDAVLDLLYSMSYERDSFEDW